MIVGGGDVGSTTDTTTNSAGEEGGVEYSSPHPVIKPANRKHPLKPESIKNETPQKHGSSTVPTRKKHPHQKNDRSVTCVAHSPLAPIAYVISSTHRLWEPRHPSCRSHPPPLQPKRRPGRHRPALASGTNLRAPHRWSHPSFSAQSKLWLLPQPLQPLQRSRPLSTLAAPRRVPRPCYAFSQASAPRNSGVARARPRVRPTPPSLLPSPSPLAVVA